MSTCPQCAHGIPSEAPYCSNCGRPRMIESLLAPRERPAWQAGFWNTVAVVGIGLFLITSSVAFLREAKAVRVARQALDSDRPELAKEILTAFLARHRDHEEALVLASLAGARTDDLEEAATRRVALEKLAPERLDDLDPKIEQAIEAAIFKRGCNTHNLFGYYDSAGALGEDFHPIVLSSFQETARRCLTSKHEDQGRALIAGLLERGVGDSLIEETYFAPLREALSAGRYEQAERLGRGVAPFSAEAKDTVDEILEPVRSKIETSRRNLASTCREIRAAPGSRVGRFWCFPKSPPRSVADVHDGWGRPLRYRALQLDTTLQCHQGFEIVSYGADGDESPNANGYPDADLFCRFTGGREQWQLPDSFWRAQS